jgi:hypothetical protein
MTTKNDPNLTTPGSERRTYSRVPFNAEIVMQSGHEEWSCNLVDISLKGMLVEPPSDLDIDINNPCAVALFLGDEASIHARVKIAHTDNGHWGLEWLHIDVDSLKHLRRLLELNLKDPSLLNRELSELG